MADSACRYNYDVAVIGGGTAGTACAVVCGENGLKTVVVEKGTCLGGSQSSGLVCPFMSHHIVGAGDEPFPPILKRLVGRLREKFPNCSTNGGISFDPNYLKLLYEEMAESAGIDIMYESALAYANTSDGKIDSVVLATKKGLTEIKAKLFVDCTGDALLADFAGATVFSGEDGVNQRTSLRFEMSGIDGDAFGRYLKEGGQSYSNTKDNLYIDHGTCPAFKQFLNDMVASGELTKQDISYIQAFSMPGKVGALAFNCPELGEYGDLLDPMVASKMYVDGRKAVYRLANAFIKHLPGFEGAYVSAISSMLGIRESRRVDAVHNLTAEDIISRRKFDDAIVRSNYPIDIHGKELSCGKIKLNGDERFYEIPFRSLLSKDIENLMVAGRCAGFDFTAQSAVRIQTSCMAMGEACAHAAAMSIKENTPIRDVDGSRLKDIMVEFE